MILYSVITEQPDSEPVTLEEAKEHLEYDSDSKDAYINALISTARSICESYTGLSFVTQERSITLDRFPCDKYYIDIPYGPVQTIVSVEYDNSDDTTTTMTEGDDFQVSESGGVMKLYPITDGVKGTWPTDVKNVVNAIRIVYQAGFDSVSGLPMPPVAKQSILMLVAKMFERRGDEPGGENILGWDVQTMLDTIKVTWSATY